MFDHATIRAVVRFLSFCVLMFWVILSVAAPVTNQTRVITLPRMPGQTKAQVMVVQMPHKTNPPPCLTFTWNPVNPVNNPVVDYELWGGNADGRLRWMFSFPASNNSLTIGDRMGHEPCWFQVYLVDQFGEFSPATNNFYRNVPVWPSICCYHAGGTNYVGWMGTSNCSYSIKQTGGVNALWTSPVLASNALMQWLIPTNLPGPQWFRVEQTTN